MITYGDFRGGLQTKYRGADDQTALSGFGATGYTRALALRVEEDVLEVVRF
jgi:hypothetical protein